MLFASAHVRITVEYGTATLWLDFRGEPVNALDVVRLRELDAALAAVEADPHLRALVVRSAKPAGFSTGLRPPALASLTTGADRAAFAWLGQQVCDRLARLPFPTIALIDGPCLGAGLELALACTYRLCVARPTTHLGFPDAPQGVPPCFGGSVRLRKRVGRRSAERLIASGRTLSGREALRLRLADHAFCERRAKIELRTFLDRLERDPPVSREPEGSAAVPGFAAERRHFANSLTAPMAQATIERQLAALDPLRGFPQPLNPVPPFPPVVGLQGEDDVANRIAAEVALRGGEVITSGDAAGVLAGIAVSLARGFVTPLEAEQARARVKVTHGFAGFDRCGLVLTSSDSASLTHAIRRRCVVAAIADGVARPFDPQAATTLAVWLAPFGCPVAPTATALPAAAAA